jgi:hypothetical protein
MPPASVKFSDYDLVPACKYTMKYKLLIVQNGTSFEAT